MTQEVTEIELAYIAGILDGEGTLVIGKHSKRENRCEAYRGYMAIANTHIPLLEYIQSRIGGKIHPQKKRYKDGICDCYTLSYSANKTRDILPKLLAYLVVKKDQAEVLLAFFERQAGNASAPISSELLEFYEECRVKIKRLKKIRYSYESPGRSELRKCSQCGKEFTWSSSNPMRLYCSNWCKRKTHWTRSNHRIAVGIPAWSGLSGIQRGEVPNLGLPPLTQGVTR